MSLTNSQLRYYDSNVLRLPDSKRKEYHRQVDFLIDKLREDILDKIGVRITKTVKAGSFAKFTILRKTSEDPVDVDVVFYIFDRSVGQKTLKSLNDSIHELLIKIYPNKDVGDFEIQRKATKVSFVGSGLNVDVVPVIQDKARPDYGWQFDLEDGSKVQTCAPCQIQFVQNRKDKDKHFRTLVRLAKKWRNHAELKPLKSFAIELILAYLLDKGGAKESIEQRFRRFLLYMAQSELKEVIWFPENTGPIGPFYDPVVILDPVQSSNNVAARITESERQQIVKAAKAAWETANFASVENDNEVWKELFGPHFKIGD